MHHPNILKCCGVSIDNEKQQILLIVELMEKNLSSMLNYLKTPEKIDALRSIASAMDYLHNSVQPPILHRDLKPENVLVGKKFSFEPSHLFLQVDKDGIFKVSDLGTSRSIGNTLEKTKAIGSLLFMAPVIPIFYYFVFFKIDITGNFIGRLHIEGGCFFFWHFSSQFVEFSSISFVWESVVCCASISGSRSTRE
jgi:serine/threonine protein kinase